MKVKKSGQLDTQKVQEISLKNDLGDLKFSIFLGEKSADDWIPFYCSLSILNSKTAQFQVLYATNASSIVSDVQLRDLQELQTFLKNLADPSATSRTFHAAAKDFSLFVENRGDLFKVRTSIDLCTLSPEKLEAGPGDSEISLSFEATSENLETFSSGLDNWFSGIQA